LSNCKKTDNLKTTVDNQDLAKLLDEKLKPITNRLSAVEKRMATKDDIANMATKDDINNLEAVTKKQFAKLDKKFDKLFDHLDKEEMKTQKRVDNLEDRVDSVEKQIAIMPA